MQTVGKREDFVMESDGGDDDGWDFLLLWCRLSHGFLTQIASDPASRARSSQNFVSQSQSHSHSQSQSQSERRLFWANFCPTNTNKHNYYASNSKPWGSSWRPRDMRSTAI